MSTTPLHRWMAEEPGLEELAAALRELGSGRVRALAAQRLEKRVYRIAIASAHGPLTVVAKRLDPLVAKRNQLVLERWLPAVGLEQVAPKLLGVSEQANDLVWHMYEDLGNATLEDSPATRPEITTAIHVLANLHARFAGHPVLAECQKWGEDHGVGFYEDSLREAIAAVSEALVVFGAKCVHGDTVRELLERLERLADERNYRMGLLAELGGPETLLHGDLWLGNFVMSPGSAARASATRHSSAVRLIDWDHVGPGCLSYDLSTLRLRFYAEEQPTIVEQYRGAAAAHGLELPADESLNVLFETAEYARMAREARWTALIAARKGSRWALESLVEINGWFDLLEPRHAAGRRW